MLDERGGERVAPVASHPVPAERVVAADARAALAEVRDHGSGGRSHSRLKQLRRVVRAEDAERVPAVVLDDQMIGVGLEQQDHRVADGGAVRDARARDRRGIGLERDVGQRPQGETTQGAVLADELRDEVVGRVRQDRIGCVVLREHAALAEDRDPVAHRDRLVDVVGDEDHGLPDLSMQTAELRLESCPRDRIERTERLVHQAGAAGRRRAHGRGRPAGAVRRRAEPDSGVASAALEADELEQLGGALLDARTLPAQELRDDGDVLADRHVREEPDLLDHVADPASQLGGRQRRGCCVRRCGYRPRRTGSAG